jgi:hypothetical protein
VHTDAIEAQNARTASMKMAVRFVPAHWPRFSSAVRTQVPWWQAGTAIPSFSTEVVRGVRGAVVALGE